MTPVITALRERKRGRVAVELDGAPWRVLPTDAVVRAGLTVGRPLDRATARELAREVRRAKALARPRDRSLRRPLRASARAAARTGRTFRRRARGGARDARARRSSTTPGWQRAAPSCSRAGATGTRRSGRPRRRRSPRGGGSASPRSSRSSSGRRALANESGTPALLRRLAGRGFSRTASTRSRRRICGRRLRSARILRHIHSTFCLQKRFSEIASDDRPLRSRRPEVAAR